MSDITLNAPVIDAEISPIQTAPVQASCDECVGSGGWYRYEPAVEGPGILYLSCMQCRGSGWLASAQA